MMPATLQDILAGPPGDFTPIAYYDKHMDCIRIELRDCSMTEIRIDSVLTLLRDNHPSPDQQPVAGLMVKGVRLLFKQWDISLGGVLMITTILNRILEQMPRISAKKQPL